jgi:hypothetical protein
LEGTVPVFRGEADRTPPIIAFAAKMGLSPWHCQEICKVIATD